MNDIQTDVMIYVTYEGTPHTRFDRAYYIDYHLPLVMAAWQRHGLKRVAAFYPAGDPSGTIAICECHFHDEVAVATAFASPEAEGVMADVARFTDVVPKRLRVMEA